MTHEPDKSDPEEARRALDSVYSMTTASLRRGLYPRWFAAAVALWTGLAATFVALDSAAFLPLVFVGLIGYYGFKRRSGAMIREIHNRRDLVLVVLISLVCGAIFIGGRIAYQDYDREQAPFVAGALVAVLLFTVMELSYRSLRARLEAEAGR